MRFRQIECPSFGRRLSNIMMGPSSDPDVAYDAYYALGGDSLHLHGEGGETTSRRAAGAWLAKRRLRDAFFLCAQICHEDWDEVAQQSIVRFTGQGVAEDVAVDLDLVGTQSIDLVYADDDQTQPFEPFVDAVGREIAERRVVHWGVRNWAPERLRAATAYATATGVTAPAALITTELACFEASVPLWPEYLPFDATQRDLVAELGLTVIAHVSDLTTGQCLLGGEDAVARFRPEWITRWDIQANAERVARVLASAESHGVTPRAINVAAILRQAFPVVGIAGGSTFLSEERNEYAQGSVLASATADVELL